MISEKNTERTNVKFELRLEVITPLAINSGNKLSPFSDYFVDRGRLYYVDEDKLSDILSEEESILNDYQKKVIDARANGGDVFLNKFFKFHNLDLQEISREDITPLSYHGEKTIELYSIIKVNEEPYIPGSSIKGAMKNCFLYYWLCETKEGKNVLDDFIRTNYSQFKKVCISLDRYQVKNALNLLKAFEKKINELAFNILDKKIKSREVASNLLISDSDTCSMASISVGNVKRASLDGADWDLRLQEYLERGTKVNLDIALNNLNMDWDQLEQGEWARILYKQTTLSELFGVVNYFFEDTRHINTERFSQDIADYDPRTEAMLYLGCGKGVFRNTVLLAIEKVYTSLGYDFKNHFAPILYKDAASYGEFPNSYSYLDGFPMGWVKIGPKVGKQSRLSGNSENKGFKEIPIGERKSYSSEQLRSGEPIEVIFVEHAKPYCKVSVLIDGEEQVFGNIAGYKALKRNILKGERCLIYWMDNNLKFYNKK